MEEDSNDLPRVTRARTRRMSALETDIRPLTPLLDSHPDRASPRPLRRTRLNSATTDLRTPTRATRASLARGETPEPGTPISLTSAKRSMRTPAKSARKQLALKEEDIVELETEQAEARLSNEKVNTSGRRSVTPHNSAERRVTRSMSKTPPVSGLVVNNIPQPQFDMDNSLEEIEKHIGKQKQTKVEVNEKDEAEVIEESIVERQSPTKIDQTMSDYSITSTSKRKAANVSKDQFKVKVKDILSEKNQAVTGTPKAKEIDLAKDSEKVKVKDKEQAVKVTPKVKVKGVLDDQQAVKVTPKAKDLDTVVAKEEKEQAVKNTPKVKVKAVLEDQQAVKVTPKAKDLDAVLAKDVEQVKVKDVHQKKQPVTGTPKAKEKDLANDGEQVKVKDVPLKNEPAVKLTPKAKVKEVLDKVTPKVKDLDIDGEEAMAKSTVTVKETDKPVAAVQEEHKPDTEVKEKSPKPEDPLPSTKKIITSSKIPIPSSKQNESAASVEDKSIKSAIPASPSDDQNDAAKVSKDPEITNEVEPMSKETSTNDDDGDEQSKQATSSLPGSEDKNTAQVTEEIRLPDLTPKTVSRVITKPTTEARKKVVFNSDSPNVETIKPTFPKTPARINVPPVEIVNIKPDFNLKSETPVKSFIKGRRNSSTPLAKPDAPKPMADEPTPALPKIDMIESLTSLETKEEPEVFIKNEKPTNALVMSDSEEATSSEDHVEEHEEEEDEDEEEEDVGNSLFVDNEVEVVENYESGDSMDSSERREIEENEIPNDGESVGSQDTVEEISEDEDEEKLSFIVSDEDVDDGDSRNSSLCFSTAEEEDFIDNDGKGPKKRRRIVVHDSSEDSDEDNDTHKKFKSSNGSIKDQEHSESLETSPKEEKAVAEKDNDKSVLETKMNKSKRASPKLKVEEVHNEVDSKEVDLTPSSPEMSCDEKETSKNISSNNKTIFEVFDSAEETDKETTKDNSMSATESHQPENESDKEMSISKEPSTKDTSIKDLEPTEEENEESKISEADSVADPVGKHSKSSASHELQKNESEAALLAELASCDLSHLKKMFNPLQKSRRQTLYVQGSEAVATEPKQKASRRSEQLNIDFKPSQSFIETLAEKKRLQSKRTRVSKSFCSAADDLNDSTMEEVQSKKAKKNDESTEEVMEPDHEMESTESLVNVVMQEPSTEDLAKQQEEQPMAKQEPSTEDQVKQQEQSKPTKTVADYMDYCESILQAANEAKLLQKKQRIAEGKTKGTKKRLLSDSKPTEAIVSTTVKVEAVNNKDGDGATKLKKNLKRLDATKHAVKQAMQLLVPSKAKKEEQSLPQKLSRQPERKGHVKGKAQGQKHNKIESKQAQVSPVKSSDEENHSTKRIRTTAGYAVETLCDQEEFETFVNRVGIVKVEPSTPRHKYFKEIPASPHPNCWFRELPSTSSTVGGLKKKQEREKNVNHNAAKSSALRFKKEIFGRNRK